MASGTINVYQLEANATCAPYRLIYPGNALNRLTDVKVTLLRDFGQREYDEVLREADIFVLQRMAMVPDLADLIGDLNRKGILAVYDIDDDLLHLDPASRQASLNPPHYAMQIESCIRACQCLQCATSELAAALSAIHPEIAVLENQLESVPPFVDKNPARPATIIGYAAGTDHGHDWSLIRDAYNGAIASLVQRGIAIETWIIGDPAIFEYVQSSRKRLLPLLPRDQYMKFLGAIDISIMPLKDSVFNRSKSDIKYLESAAMGTPVVASDLVYGRTLRHEETGLIFRSPEEFASGLTRLVTDRPFAQRIAREAHRYVAENRLIDQHAARWASTYKIWHARREELLHRTGAKTSSF
ncbi:MAG: glycosyltransferase family 4 protein [Betaproteobacteria bacterium]|nr:MAG: glycosyltransferase family 4 protein [Betaproteobacteria bacterium]